MARDYTARKYIEEKASRYEDDRLTGVLIRAFDLICGHEEPDGCLSTSVALHVILRSLGYDPKICYGLCVTPAGYEVYHAWLELDGMILDLAIYGNSHFSKYWHEEPIGPIVFEGSNQTNVKYHDHVFDSDWDECMIAQGIHMGSVANYIANAPYVRHPSGNGRWKLIFDILCEPFSTARQQYLQQYVSNETF